MASTVFSVRGDSPATLAAQLTAALAPLTDKTILGVDFDNGDTQRVGGLELFVTVTHEPSATTLLAPYQARVVQAASVQDMAADAQALFSSAPADWWSAVFTAYTGSEGRRTKPFIGLLFTTTDAVNGPTNWAVGGSSGGGGGGILAGDVTGPSGANTVERIRGVNVDPTAPTSGTQLIYNGLTGQYEPALPTQYFVSGAAAQAAAPFINGTTVVIYPGSPTSEAGTYEVTSNGGAAFPADYTKVSDLTDTASEVSIVDAGGYYPGAGNVEAALQQIGAGTYGQLSGPLVVGANVLDQVSTAMQGAAIWQLELVNGTLRYVSVVTGTHDGATGYGVEENITLTPGIGVAPFTVDVDVSAGNLRLTVAMTAPGWSYRVRRQVLAS